MNKRKVKKSTRHAVKVFREKEKKNPLHSRPGHYKNLDGQRQPLDALLQVNYEGNLCQCMSIKNMARWKYSFTARLL